MNIIEFFKKIGKDISQFSQKVFLEDQYVEDEKSTLKSVISEMPPEEALELVTTLGSIEKGAHDLDKGVEGSVGPVSSNRLGLRNEDKSSEDKEILEEHEEVLKQPRKTEQKERD